MTHMITVKFFAAYRELMNTASLTFAHDDINNVYDLRIRIQSQYPNASFLQAAETMVAVNHQLCDEQQALVDGDEVAFFPPVTGG